MRRVLITGASRGIGRAIAERLATAGSELILHGRDRQALAVTCRLVEQAGAQAIEAVGDLATEAGVQAVLAVAGGAGLDALVHNAGVAVVKPLGEITLEEWQASLAVNVTAPFLLTARLLPMLLAAQGSVVNVLSTAARQGFPGWSAYCAAKFALRGFSAALREELRGAGVRVIDIVPSATDTELWRSVPGTWNHARMLSASRVADAVAFALSQPSGVLIESIAIGNIAGTL